MNLGGLENLPGCRELLIRKHTAEVERVMRLWRALVQQMRGQVTKPPVKEGLREVDTQADARVRSLLLLLMPRSSLILSLATCS